MDEPDTVKTDGKVLATMRESRLTLYDVTGTSTATLGSLALPGVADAEILLADDTIVAIGGDTSSPPERPGTRVVTISIADPREPRIAEDVRYDAASLSARQHGSAIRLVLQSGLPDLPFVEPGGKRTQAQAQRENRALVDKTTIEDWLPTVTSDGKSRRLLDCTDVAVPSEDLALATTSIVGFDADRATTLDAIGLAGRTGIAYESANHLYLATQDASPVWERGIGDCTIPTCGMPSPGTDTGSSYLFDFALDGAAATHVASGEVEGAIRDRWSMDEAGDVLRVAVSPTRQTGPFNSVVTLRRQGTDLVEEGRLDGLGLNEEPQVGAVVRRPGRAGDLPAQGPALRREPHRHRAPEAARQSSTSPASPPTCTRSGAWRMIGVGEGPSAYGWGARIGLFDVRDVTKVRETRHLRLRP
ncbi:hypothetical protein G5V59_13300 [Nocardioides sp. W3-2-3]|nr:hypothetical protein [Nocardioides convexus]